MHLMSKTKLLAFIFTFARCFSASNECPAHQEMLCEKLRSLRGYTYTVQERLNLCARDYEQGWYYQNGTFIVDSTPTASGNRLAVVVDVTPHNLTLSVCESVQWQLVCGQFTCFVNYTVTVQSFGAPDPLPRNNTHLGIQKGNDLPAWSIALITIAVVVCITITIVITVKFFNKPNPTPTDVL